MRPRVRQEPIWRLRAARAVAVTCLAIIAVVLVISAVHRESPLRPLHPVTSRIHFGTDNDGTQATQAAKSLGPTESSRAVAAEIAAAEGESGH